MSLAGFNPNATLLTANPAAQMHVYSGGARGGSQEQIHDQVNKALGVIVPDDIFAALSVCTSGFTDLSDILCSQHVTDEMVDRLYELLAGSAPQLLPPTTASHNIH